MQDEEEHYQPVTIRKNQERLRFTDLILKIYIRSRQQQDAHHIYSIPETGFMERCGSKLELVNYEREMNPCSLHGSGNLHLGQSSTIFSQSLHFQQRKLGEASSFVFLHGTLRRDIIGDEGIFLC
jgi:hypothetical protein